jgi:hypothetical protein
MVSGTACTLANVDPGSFSVHSILILTVTSIVAIRVLVNDELGSDRDSNF